MKKRHTLWILYKKENFLLKDIFVPVQAMQAYGGSGVTSPLVLKLFTT
jgi:hypothetical protein